MFYTRNPDDDLRSLQRLALTGDLNACLELLVNLERFNYPSGARNLVEFRLKQGLPVAVPGELVLINSSFKTRKSAYYVHERAATTQGFSHDYVGIHTPWALYAGLRREDQIYAIVGYFPGLQNWQIRDMLHFWNTRHYRPLDS